MRGLFDCRITGTTTYTTCHARTKISWVHVAAEERITSGRHYLLITKGKCLLPLSPTNSKVGWFVPLAAGTGNGNGLALADFDSIRSY